MVPALVVLGHWGLKCFVEVGVGFEVVLAVHWDYKIEEGD